jgi:2-haloacid dehalogenase
MAAITAMAIDPASVKALVFDVFGTVVDWRGSIIRELQAVGASKKIEADWATIADEWRAGYQPAMQRVRTGALPWTNIDTLHRMILDGLLAKHGIGGLSEAEKQRLNRAWHRLDPWPDAVAGLARLRKRYTLGTLSNGNVALLVAMARHAGLPWDVIFSAELVQHYKPDPEAYQMVPQLLMLERHEVMLVAAHGNDLKAAAGQGLRTAYIHRPLEHGPRLEGHAAAGDFDFSVRDFEQLAQLLGT